MNERSVPVRQRARRSIPMVDPDGLILIAHSNWRTLLAFYRLLDAEGYFVAPCFSRGDLLRYSSRYKPDLILTTDPLSGEEDPGLLEAIQGRAPGTEIIVLRDVPNPGPIADRRVSPGVATILRILEARTDPVTPMPWN
jgi:hypothetical protein